MNITANNSANTVLLGDNFNLTWLADGLGGSQAHHLQRTMREIGVGEFASRYMSEKGDFFVLRADNLRAPAANILKQEFLSKGAEVAVNARVILNEPEFSSALMMATAAQYANICKGLRRQQFGLPLLADEIELALANIRRESWVFALPGGARQMQLSTATKIMGILNVTPDSFSDGGSFVSVEKAVARALEMQWQGAYIIDVGGESTRPGHKPISIDEEISRVEPVIRALRQQDEDLLISIDTYKPEVAAAALAAGADIINDIWGLQYAGDTGHEMARLAAAQGCPVIVMHNQVMSDKPAGNYSVPQELSRFFRRSRQIAREAGMHDEQLIFDIGFGFGKNAEQNMEALAQTAALRVLGRPVLVATSRKSTLGTLTGRPIAERLLATAATTAQAAMNGAALVRVHDVAETSDVLAVCRKIYQINIL